MSKQPEVSASGTQSKSREQEKEPSNLDLRSQGQTLIAYDAHPNVSSSIIQNEALTTANIHDKAFSQAGARI
jgi:hypothetical protein